MRYFIVVVSEYRVKVRREESPRYFDWLLPLYSNLFCFLTMVCNYSLLILIPPVTAIIVLLTSVTLKRFYHLPCRSRNTVTKAPGGIAYLLAGGYFDRNTCLIRDSSAIVSFSALARLSVSKLCFRFKIVLFNAQNLRNTPNTNLEGTNPFGPIVSWIDLISMRIITFSVCLWCLFFTTSTILLSVYWFLSTFKMELCASTPWFVNLFQYGLHYIYIR